MLKFLWGVRRQLRGYRDYIKQLNHAIEILETQNADLLTANQLLKAQLGADLVIHKTDSSYWRRRYNQQSKTVEMLESKIEELENEIEELESEDEGTPWEAEADEGLLNTLDEIGLDPSRRYSVGELLEIKAALERAGVVR